MDVLRKRLFQSPSTETEKVTEESTDLLMMRLQIDHDIDANYQTLNKEQHQQRLKQLRQMLTTLAEDDWKYEDTDAILGLH